MIGSLKGSVESLGIDNCIIETAGGVGYRVFMPAAQLAQLTQGASVRLHIHTAVREDAIVLYGFLSQEYYDLFELLLTISGVGPKMALGISSAVKPDAFYLAVQSRDIKVLTKLPGIGKKTAERLLLELKDKVGPVAAESGDSFGEDGSCRRQRCRSGGNRSTCFFRLQQQRDYARNQENRRRREQDERGNIEAGLKADDEIISRR